MHKSPNKKHKVIETTIRLTQNHPTRDKRLLPFTSMLLLPITYESKNKQFLRELAQPIPVTGKKVDGQFASMPDDNKIDTFYKTYQSAASRITKKPDYLRITKKLYPYPSFRIFSDLSLSAPGSIHTDNPSVPSGLGTKPPKGNSDINSYINSPHMDDDTLIMDYITMLESDGKKSKNMLHCPSRDETNQRKEHDTAVKRTVGPFVGFMNIDSRYQMHS